MEKSTRDYKEQLKTLPKQEAKELICTLLSDRTIGAGEATLLWEDLEKSHDEQCRERDQPCNKSRG